MNVAVRIQMDAQAGWPDGKALECLLESHVVVTEVIALLSFNRQFIIRIVQAEKVAIRSKEIASCLLLKPACERQGKAARRPFQNAPPYLYDGLVAGSKVHFNGLT